MDTCLKLLSKKTNVSKNDIKEWFGIEIDPTTKLFEDFQKGKVDTIGLMEKLADMFMEHIFPKFRTQAKTHGIESDAFGDYAKKFAENITKHLPEKYLNEIGGTRKLAEGIINFIMRNPEKYRYVENWNGELGPIIIEANNNYYFGNVLKIVRDKMKINISENVIEILENKIPGESNIFVDDRFIKIDETKIKIHKRRKVLKSGKHITEL